MCSPSPTVADPAETNRTLATCLTGDFVGIPHSDNSEALRAARDTELEERAQACHGALTMYPVSLPPLLLLTTSQGTPPAFLYFRGARRGFAKAVCPFSPLPVGIDRLTKGWVRVAGRRSPRSPLLARQAISPGTPSCCPGSLRLRTRACALRPHASPPQPCGKCSPAPRVEAPGGAASVRWRLPLLPGEGECRPRGGTRGAWRTPGERRARPGGAEPAAGGLGTASSPRRAASGRRAQGRLFRRSWAGDNSES